MAYNRDHSTLRRRGRRAATAIMLRGPILLGIALVMMTLGLFSATGLQWNENVFDLLPRDDSTISTSLRFVEQFDVLDNLYFDIGPNDDQELPTMGELIAVAEELYQRLLLSGFFERIVYRHELEDIHTTINLLTGHRASLFTEHDKQLLEAKLDLASVQSALTSWKQRLVESPAPFLSQAMYTDPLGINNIFIAKLADLQAVETPLTTSDGRLFSSDYKHILIIARPRLPATDSANGQRLIEFIDNALASIHKDCHPANVRVAYFGGHRATVDNARQIKHDIGITVTISVIAITLISCLVFRRRHFVLLTFVPVVFGASFALGAIRYIDPFISAISVGCGSMFIGISVDYAIHFLYSFDQIPVRTNVRYETIRIVQRLFAPILLSAATTILAFCTLELSILPGYRSLGRFAVLGLFGAVTCSLTVLPTIGTRLVTQSNREPVLHLSQYFPPLFGLIARRRRLFCVLLVAFSVFSIIGLMRVGVEGDIRKLNSLSSEARRDRDQLSDSFGDVLKSSAFAVKADSLQEALRLNEMLAKVLARDREGGAIREIGGVTSLLPSLGAQVINRKRWADFWNDERQAALRENLRHACHELRMRPAAFGEFCSSLPGPMPAIDYDKYREGLIGELLENYITDSPQCISVLTPVRLQNAAEFDSLVDDVEKEIPRVLAFNGPFFVRCVVTMIYQEMERLGMIAVVAIALLVLLVTRRFSVLAAMLVPLLVSLLWTFGWLGWLGIRLNMMNAVVSVFIFGLIVDYGIFLNLALRRSEVDASGSLGHTCGAITISALTSMCGMGALIFARHPALQSIGITALIGIGSGWLSVFIIIPLLYCSRSTERGQQ